MDPSLLKAFVAVAETGSFSTAAERLFLTQPAVSKRIQVLEQSLNAPLFDRIGRRARLTPAGTVLLAKARELLLDLEDLRRGIARLSGEMGGELSIATSHHIGLHRLPSALKAFHLRHPQVRLDLRFVDSEQGCRAVRDGEVELAVVTLPQAMPDLKLIPVWDDRLEFVVAAHHPLARLRAPGLRELLQHPALLPGAGTYTRALVLKGLGRTQDRLQVGLSTNYMEVLKMLTGIGLGWSVLPHTLIDGSLKVIHIPRIVMKRRLGIAVHTKRTLSNAAQALIALLTD